MASAIQAGFRLEEHYATRDAALPAIASKIGLDLPQIVPGVRQTGVIAQANQAAIDAVLLQAVRQLVDRVADLEAQLAAKGK